MDRFSTCFWFDGKAEEAARFYCSLFEDAEITQVSRPDPRGPALAVSFRLGSQKYMALNGGPGYSLSPASSIVALCDDQDEIDRLWAALGEGGEYNRCGWLTDRFGMSWQVVPRSLPEMMAGPDTARAARVTQAFLQMSKLELGLLEAAYHGRQ